MTSLLLWKKPTTEKNKKLVSRHLKNVKDVMVMELNLDLNQSPAQLVADTDKLDQVRDFLQFNRRVQIVVDLENKFLRPVESVKVLVKNKLKKKKRAAFRLGDWPLP